MKPNSTRREIVRRRAELMAELFLEEMNPVFLSRPTTDMGYDLLAGFKNEKGGVNTFAIAVKAIEKPAATQSIHPQTYTRLAHSNIPTLMLVADVKQNELYFCWLRPRAKAGRQSTISVPLTPITESSQRLLEKRFGKAEPVAAAG